VTGEPFVLAGAVHVTVAEPFPAVALTADGAPGVPAGTTGADAADAGPVPTAFFAATVNVYVNPLERPVIDAEVAPPVLTVVPAEDVTVYPVIGLPPLDAGAAHVTTAVPSPAVAATETGAPGALGRTTGAEGAEAGLLPRAFFAVTVNV
jgi:hypothetical protein